MPKIIDKIKNLPQAPGVYFFCGEKGKILYIGKATNLKSRVGSYFRGAEVAGRSEWISLMISQVENIEYEQTDSVLEALILESNLIKKHQPKYNTLEKDDKSFSYFAITKEEFPRVLIVRKTDLESSHQSSVISNQKDKLKIQNKKIQDTSYKIHYTKTFGPYTSKQQMQIALKIIRRIFPFHALKQKTEKGCLDFQLGKCPGPYAGAISVADYKKNIRGIRMILEGKKKSLITKMEKEMTAFAKKNEFEKAGEIRNKIFALQHIQDVALMSREFNREPVISNRSPVTEENLLVTSYELLVSRIEAYDISNISGNDAVGSMIVFENGVANKSQYRKFKIKTVEGSNDVAMMREVLLRRFGNDWPMPDLILLDGGLGHLNMAEKLLHIDLGLSVHPVKSAEGGAKQFNGVNIVSVAKGPTRKKLDIRYDANLQKNPNPQIENILQDDNLVKSIMDEAHRFAITFHRKLRNKSALQ
ncbi:MAG: hypothetical protein ACD_67C00196G0003 [uncultured bacterium]|nr:MAG: hypothetical protein ACD_67C00196G0003 [uncultured bacterium]